jgi:hypothetical protein
MMAGTMDVPANVFLRGGWQAHRGLFLRLHIGIRMDVSRRRERFRGRLFRKFHVRSSGFSPWLEFSASKSPPPASGRPEGAGVHR